MDSLPCPRDMSHTFRTGFWVDSVTEILGRQRASEWTLRLGARDVTEPASLLAVVSELKHAISNSNRVQWTAEGELDHVTAAIMEHLPPPATGGGDHAEEWRTRHVYGALFERLGPGFVVIRERRSTRDGAIYNINDTALLTCISQLRVPSSHACKTCDMLVDEGLVMRRAGRGIYLPFRLKYPPTPFLAI